MKRLLSFIIIAAILWTSLTACQDRITIDEYDIADAPIARPLAVSFLQYHAGCLYFPADTVMRYSINSGTLTALCIDPLCFHDTTDCPFFMVGTNPEIHGTRLFYEGGNIEDYSFPWYVFDIDSGKRQLILTENEMGSIPTLHRGRLYYRRNILREGESAANLASYDHVLFCLDAETLEKRQLCVLGRADEAELDSIVGFFGDRILWRRGTEWYTTDLDSGDRQAFGTFKDIELNGMLCDRENGVLYCMRNTDELLGYIGTSSGPFADKRPVYNRIPTIIRADGSITELPDIHATGFLEVTADYFYYYKFGEITETSIIDGALYRCRHDGSAEECVLTAEELNGAEIGRIAGGAVYLREDGALVKLDFETKTRDVIFTRETK